MKNIKIVHKRHILKTVTWRIIATVATILIVWSFTGDVSLSLSAGLVEVIIKMILYYIHERVWYKYDFGVLNKENRTYKD